MGGVPSFNMTLFGQLLLWLQYTCNWLSSYLEEQPRFSMKAQGKSPWRSMDRRKISPANLLKVRCSGEISSVSSVSVYGLMRNLQKLHWCKQIPSVSAKGARSSIEKLFYFTRISEDKWNESLEATQTHTSSIILCVIAGYTFGWKQCLALRRWKYIAVEENFWGWSWKCDISSCSLCLFVCLFLKIVVWVIKL